MENFEIIQTKVASLLGQYTLFNRQITSGQFNEAFDISESLFKSQITIHKNTFNLKSLFVKMNKMKLLENYETIVFFSGQNKCSLGSLLILNLTSNNVVTDDFMGKHCFRGEEWYVESLIKDLQSAYSTKNNFKRTMLDFIKIMKDRYFVGFNCIWDDLIMKASTINMNVLKFNNLGHLFSKLDEVYKIKITSDEREIDVSNLVRESILSLDVTINRKIGP